MRFSFTIIIVIALGLTFSCSEEFQPTPYTYSKLFTGQNNKTWKIKLVEDALNGEVIDRWMNDCLTDDRFIFYANAEHSYEATTGSKKCFEEPEADRLVEAWSFNNATAALVMIIPFIADFAVPYTVREVDEGDMVVEIFYDQENTTSRRVHLEAIDEE